jgi:hypothetical protein
MTRPQVRGWLVANGLRATWMRILSWRLKPKAAAAPNSGRGLGLELDPLILHKYNYSRWTFAHLRLRWKQSTPC